LAYRTLIPAATATALGSRAGLDSLASIAARERPWLRRRIAAELAEDGVHYRGYRVDVIDEYGNTIGSIPVIVGDHDAG
jgi:hypothetical protein